MDMIYISHPYTGNEEANKRHAERIRKHLQDKNPDVCYVLPLGMFGTNNTYYCQILAYCIELERRCDAVLFCPGWENSAGCKAEMAVSLQQGMIIDYMNPCREDLSEEDEDE